MESGSHIKKKTIISVHWVGSIVLIYSNLLMLQNPFRNSLGKLLPAALLIIVQVFISWLNKVTNQKSLTSSHKIKCIGLCLNAPHDGLMSCWVSQDSSDLSPLSPQRHCTLPWTEHCFVEIRNLTMEAALFSMLVASTNNLGTSCQRQFRQNFDN